MKVTALRLVGSLIGVLAIGTTIAAPSLAAAAGSGKAQLTDKEFQRGKEIFFQRCSGCHGSFRKGGIGKQLAPELLGQGTDYYKAFISHGSEAGMPEFGADLSAQDIDILARYVQSAEPAPPDWGPKEIAASHKVLVPVDKRPTLKLNKLDLDNLFAVVLRDAGQIALIDGNTKKIVQTIRTGYSVHTTRVSASGRYLYAIGRDAKVTLIDLWMDPPAAVAEVRAGLEARSMDVSKFKGFEDRYAIVGDFWPPQYVILDGKTLQPLAVKSTRTATDPVKSAKRMARVAAIGAGTSEPEFVVTVKDTGKILLVNYSDLNKLDHVTLDGAPFLAEGGYDSSHRYFLVAANLANRVVVVDTKDNKVVKSIETGNKPNPSRGANFVDPKYGPVWATPHLGDNSVALIGTDPTGHPGNAWKVVRKLAGPTSGAVSIKTHPRSNNLWVDYGFNNGKPFNQEVAVWSIRALEKGPVMVPIVKMAGLSKGRVEQAEYNKAGNEIWFSVRANKHQQSAIVVLDDATRKVKAVIKDKRLITPSGKFNTYNTLHDIY